MTGPARVAINRMKILPWRPTRSCHTYHRGVVASELVEAVKGGVVVVIIAAQRHGNPELRVTQRGQGAGHGRGVPQHFILTARKGGRGGHPNGGQVHVDAPFEALRDARFQRRLLLLVVGTVRIRRHNIQHAHHRRAPPLALQRRHVRARGIVVVVRENGDARRDIVVAVGARRVEGRGGVPAESTSAVVVVVVTATAIEPNHEAGLRLLLLLLWCVAATDNTAVGHADDGYSGAEPTSDRY